MRHLSPLVLLLAACATPVRDFPPGAAPGSGRAVLAGSMRFHGTGIPRRLLLRSAEGHDISLRPAEDPFLVEVPAGTYEVRSFGGFYPTVDRPRLVAVAGETRYIGSLHVARDAEGDLRIIVKDNRQADEAGLRTRYPAVPGPLRMGLMESALEPTPGTTTLAIAVERPEPPRPYPYWGYSRWYWGGRGLRGHW